MRQKKYHLTKQRNCANTLTFNVGVDPEAEYCNEFWAFDKCALISPHCNIWSSDLNTLDLILIPQF